MGPTATIIENFLDTSRNCTGLYSADTSRCSSGPCIVDTSRSSTLLCSADTSRCSSGPCGVDTSRNCTGLYSVNTFRNIKGKWQGYQSEAKLSESFENDVFSIWKGSDTFDSWKMVHSRNFLLLWALLNLLKRYIQWKEKSPWRGQPEFDRFYLVLGVEQEAAKLRWAGGAQLPGWCGNEPHQKGGRFSQKRKIIDKTKFRDLTQILIHFVKISHFRTNVERNFHHIY